MDPSGVGPSWCNPYGWIHIIDDVDEDGWSLCHKLQGQPTFWNPSVKKVEAVKAQVGPKNPGAQNSGRDLDWYVKSAILCRKLQPRPLPRTNPRPQIQVSRRWPRCEGKKIRSWKSGSPKQRERSRLTYQELDTGSIVPAPLSVRRNPRHSCGASLSASSFLHWTVVFARLPLPAEPWDSPLESTSKLLRQSRFFFSFQKTKKSGPELRYFLQCHVWFFLSIFLFSPSASCFPALSRPF